MQINNISSSLKYNNTASFKGKDSKIEQKFIRIRNEIDKKMSELNANENDAEWNFCVDSSSENLKKLEKEKKRTENYYLHNYALFKKLNYIKKTNKLTSKRHKSQLETLLNIFNITSYFKNDLKALETKEKEIEKKFNLHQRIVNGRVYTEADINLILENSKDEKFREKLFLAKASAGDIIADDVIELIKRRNEFAQKQRYGTYFDYQYDSQTELPLADLLKMTDTVYQRVKDINYSLIRSENSFLSKIFGIPAEKLMRFHKSYSTNTGDGKTVKQKLFTVDKVIQTVKKAYMGMGFDIDNMPIKTDLYPRKNKDTSAFCIAIIPGKDIRVMANLTNSTDGLLTLMHEFGHAVYEAKSKSDLPFVEQSPSGVMNESVALMMEDVGNFEVLNDISKRNESLSLKQRIKISRVNNIISDLFDIEFERELYKNPYQDPKLLWKKLMTKYYYDSEKEPLTNRWATNTLLITNPAYCPNYFLADIIKVQMYSTLKQKFGELTKNPNVANFLNNKLFKYGSSMSDNILVNKITGKDISPDDFCRTVE